MKNPYKKNTKNVKLLPSFVYYADILGYSTMSRTAINKGKGNRFLKRLRDSLSSAYKRVKSHSEKYDISFYSVKVFTDNIVIGYPLLNPDFNYGEPELGDMFSISAEFQAGLTAEGFLIRGGIAYGNHFMDDDIVFGEALLQAIEQDKNGGAPRITLAKSARNIVEKQLSFYAHKSHSPQNEDLLEDADGKIFLNYLNIAFIAFPEGRISFKLLEMHRDTIVQGLEKYKGDSGIRAKYLWSASYHNYIVEEFLKNHPVQTNPEVDEKYAAACRNAQKLSKYIIDINSYIATPSRITKESLGNKNNF